MGKRKPLIFPLFKRTPSLLCPGRQPGHFSVPPAGNLSFCRHIGYRDHICESEVLSYVQPQLFISLSQLSTAPADLLLPWTHWAAGAAGLPWARRAPGPTGRTRS